MFTSTKEERGLAWKIAMIKFHEHVNKSKSMLNEKSYLLYLHHDVHLYKREEGFSMENYMNMELSACLVLLILEGSIFFPFCFIRD